MSLEYMALTIFVIGLKDIRNANGIGWSRLVDVTVTRLQDNSKSECVGEFDGDDVGRAELARAVG